MRVNLDEELRRAQQYADIPKPVFAAVVAGLTLVGALVFALHSLERSLG